MSTLAERIAAAPKAVRGGVERAYVWRAGSKSAPWSNAVELVELAKRLGLESIVVKCRDGKSASNAKQLPAIAAACREGGLTLDLWAWCYPRDDGDKGGRLYVRECADLIVGDVKRYGACNVELNCEAPWSWSMRHKWAQGHEAAWGTERERREELELRAEHLLLRVREGVKPERLAVCTFPWPSRHALPFAVFAKYAQISPMAYTGDLTARMVRSRREWEQREGDIEGWEVPATKARGVEGVRAARAAVNPWETLSWWSLCQAPADVVAELARR